MVAELASVNSRRGREGKTNRLRFFSRDDQREQCRKGEREEPELDHDDRRKQHRLDRR